MNGLNREVLEILKYVRDSEPAPTFDLRYPHTVTKFLVNGVCNEASKYSPSLSNIIRQGIPGTAIEISAKNYLNLLKVFNGINYPLEHANYEKIRLRLLQEATKVIDSFESIKEYMSLRNSLNRAERISLYNSHPDVFNFSRFRSPNTKIFSNEEDRYIEHYSQCMGAMLKVVAGVEKSKLSARKDLVYLVRSFIEGSHRKSDNIFNIDAESDLYGLLKSLELAKYIKEGGELTDDEALLIYLLVENGLTFYRAPNSRELAANLLLLKKSPVHYSLNELYLPHVTEALKSLESKSAKEMIDLLLTDYTATFVARTKTSAVTYYSSKTRYHNK